LIFDKHFDSVYPDPQLEYILESCGIFDYSAELVLNKEFKHCVCGDSDYITESFFPNIQGDHWNPYIRFKSSAVCGSQQCTKIMDLVGINHKDLNDPAFHDVVFNSLVLSYPFEIDHLLLDEKYRSRAQYKTTKNGNKSSQKKITKYNLIDRMNRCYSNFFKELHELLKVPDNKILGCCDRLHLWSSSIPLMPNAHHHVLLPHFCYYNIDSDERESIDQMVLDPLVDQYKDCINIIRSKGNDLDVSYDCDVEGIKILSGKIESTQHKFIVDRDRYDEFRNVLSNELKDQLGFESLTWFGLTESSNSKSMIELPLDLDAIKELWSKCVYNEFDDIFGSDHDRIFDVQSKFITAKEKSKILHILQYSTRPPVGDLDLLLKQIPSVVLSYDTLDLNMVKLFLQDKFVSAVMKDNVVLSNRYESMLKKFENLLSLYSGNDFYSWLQFLSTWSTQTKVRGFWRNIQRYMLDPDHKLLIDKEVCPICNRSIANVRYVSNPVIDIVIIRNKSNFCIYNFDGG